MGHGLHELARHPPGRHDLGHPDDPDLLPVPGDDRSRCPALAIQPARAVRCAGERTSLGVRGRSGDGREGGIWWNTHHPYKAGEALASATLLATLLYEQTRSSFALGQARKYLAWANTAGFSAVERKQLVAMLQRVRANLQGEAPGAPS